MAKISVLMPVYKTNERHLREAIESILNQTYNNFEFLILDDCPDDPRKRIVESYKDKRIKYFLNDKNLGISASRNKLIDMSEGEYLAIFDHDDISYPERLEKQAAYLDSHKNVGAVSSWFRTIPKNKITKYPTQNNDIKISLQDNCALSHSATMIRKSVLTDNNIRYEQECSPAEDYALFCRLSKVTDLYNMQDVLLDYRWHETNTSITQQNKMAKAHTKVKAFNRVLSPEFYHEAILRSEKRTNIYLFGRFKLLKIVERYKYKKVYLFGFILIYTSDCFTNFWGMSD
jgi:glycosyltransferase involved in cell wall biosynthesis